MMKSVFVIGAGTMGRGIAQVAAAAGDRVFLYDHTNDVAFHAKDAIEESLKRAAAKNYVSSEEAARTLENLHPVISIEIAREAQIVIEAVKEDMEIKRAVFSHLEKIVLAETALWTNTSMISITAIAAELVHPERVLGTHFFNPAPRMKLVEIIVGKRTSKDSMQFAEETLIRWKKTPILAPDSPGFIVNRILDVIKREALSLMQEGVPAEHIDTGVRLGLNFPMGPLELMDLVGLDTTLDCLITQAKAMGRAANFEPLSSLVRDGKKGRKSGEGFYTYTTP